MTAKKTTLTPRAVRLAHHFLNERMRLKLTLREVGEAVGYSHVHVYDVETGRRTPSPGYVVRFAELAKRDYETLTAMLCDALVEQTHEDAAREFYAPGSSPRRRGRSKSRLVRGGGR